MYYQRNLFILLILFAVISCNSPGNDISDEWVPSEPIDASELKARKGDCLLFTDSANNYFAGTVLTFNKSKGDIWYAICFTNYTDTAMLTAKLPDTLKLHARKVPYYNFEDHLIGFDITWARDTLIENHVKGVMGNIAFKGMEKMEIMGEGSAFGFQDFLNSYYFSRDQRLFPGKYSRDLLDTSFHPAIFITVQEVMEAEKKNEILKRKY